VVNTPPQIMIYQALGNAVPQLAHMPMIQAPNGEKLSKRHAAVAVLDYRDNGYLADGVLNYLARLGWSHGDQEIFSRAELIELFNWEHVGRTAGKYDVKKFSHVQASHLRMRSDAELGALALPFLLKRGLAVSADDRRLTPAMALVKPRASTLVEVADAVDYFFRDTLVFDEQAKQKLLTADAVPVLNGVLGIVKTTEPFTTHALEANVKAWSESANIALKDIAQPARVALTGRKASPGLWEVMEILGRDVTIARLEAGIAQCAATPTSAT
jgi:glutamyl-tRNA synthetase